MRDIYRYNDEFDKNVIFSKISDIEDKIQEAEDEEPSKEQNNKIRELMYAKFMAGLKLSTGFNHF